jgi:hypothetical protein
MSGTSLSPMSMSRDPQDISAQVSMHHSLFKLNFLDFLSYYIAIKNNKSVKLQKYPKYTKYLVHINLCTTATVGTQKQKWWLLLTGGHLSNLNKSSI